MQCDTKTMLKTAALVASALAVLYFTVPAVQALVLASAPVLLVLICPISMLLMMRTMNAPKGDGGGDAKETEATPRIEGAEMRGD